MKQIFISYSYHCTDRIMFGNKLIDCPTDTYSTNKGLINFLNKQIIETESTLLYFKLLDI